MCCLAMRLTDLRREGTEASNKAITRDDLTALWKKTYVPAGAALVMAGDVTEAQARALAEKYFGAVAWGEYDRGGSGSACGALAGRVFVRQGGISADDACWRWARGRRGRRRTMCR